MHNLTRFPVPSVREYGRSNWQRDLLVTRTNRLWYLNDESQNEWWYTESYNPGNGIAPVFISSQSS